MIFYEQSGIRLLNVGLWMSRVYRTVVTHAPVSLYISHVVCNKEHQIQRSQLAIDLTGLMRGPWEAAET